MENLKVFDGLRIFNEIVKNKYFIHNQKAPPPIIVAGLL